MERWPASNLLSLRPNIHRTRWQVCSALMLRGRRHAECFSSDYVIVGTLVVPVRGIDGLLLSEDILVERVILDESLVVIHVTHVHAQAARHHLLSIQGTLVLILHESLSLSDD